MNVRNLRTEAHLELKQANNAWNDCVAKNFLPQWLAGASLDIEEVCSSELTKMQEQDAALYADKPSPFKGFANV